MSKLHQCAFAFCSSLNQSSPVGSSGNIQNLWVLKHSSGGWVEVCVCVDGVGLQTVDSQ